MIEPPTFVEIEFRDGKRQVPGYLASLMSGIETHRLTYDQSVDAANRRMEADFINIRHERTLEAHFKEHRRWG